MFRSPRSQRNGVEHKHPICKPMKRIPGNGDLLAEQFDVLHWANRVFLVNYLEVLSRIIHNVTQAVGVSKTSDKTRLATGFVIPQARTNVVGCLGIHGEWRCREHMTLTPGPSGAPDLPKQETISTVSLKLLPCCSLCRVHRTNDKRSHAGPEALGAPQDGLPALAGAIGWLPYFVFLT